MLTIRGKKYETSCSMCCCNDDYSVVFFVIQLKSFGYGINRINIGAYYLANGNYTQQRINEIGALNTIRVY
jgi:hypothetical protein